MRLIQQYSSNQGASQAFSEIFGGFIIQLFFFSSVALWSFNESFEKDVRTSKIASPKQSGENPQSKQPSVTYEEGQIGYMKILKPFGIIFLSCSIITLILPIFFMFYFIDVFDLMTLIFRLILFAILGIIGAILWERGTENEFKSTRNFRKQYEEQKRRELEDRF